MRKLAHKIEYSDNRSDNRSDTEIISVNQPLYSYKVTLFQTIDFDFILSPIKYATPKQRRKVDDKGQRSKLEFYVRPNSKGHIVSWIRTYDHRGENQMTEPLGH